MLKKAIFITVINFCLFSYAQAQEIVTGLFSNPLLTKVNTEITKGPGADTLALPVVEDFTGTGVIPDQNKWTDNFVFINNTYTNNQITTGVATFDALDQKGELYASAGPIVFMADKLTSKPILLNYPSTDNIYLSFWHEAGGLGDMPEVNDSLVLQFYAPSELKWYSVWRSNEKNPPGFKAVILKITNPRYLKRGFQFRFVNYASLSPSLIDPSMMGNCDQWNVDYIVLGRNRNEADTLMPDVAFKHPFRSLLKTHESMPWNQFEQVYLQEMGSSIPITYKNNDAIVRNVTRNFEIFDVYDNSVARTFSAGAANIDPESEVIYPASLIYTYSSPSVDSALFRVKSWLITDAFDRKENDTVTYYQHFSNYFAFDDGSAEQGYGINGNGSSSAMAAVRFRSYMEDTIRAVNICFNDSYQNANRRLFDLLIWDDNNGVPGNILYSLNEVMVNRPDDVNGFKVYPLPEGVPVDGVFYAGWRQRSETFLNAGLDINSPNTGRQYYSISGEWYQSQVTGSLMIRPVLGAPLVTGINDVNTGLSRKLRFGPNPASDYITIYSEPDECYGDKILIFTNLNGVDVMKVSFSEMIDISRLRNGMYIITATCNGRPYARNRLIINK